MVAKFADTLEPDDRDQPATAPSHDPPIWATVVGRLVTIALAPVLTGVLLGFVGAVAYWTFRALTGVG